MASVREATLELFRAHGMTTIFGNPGSTELPMLRDLPEDFTCGPTRRRSSLTAGQQVHGAQITHEALLTNRDATLVAQPYVKWSHEPPRPQDVPGAIGRAIHHATLAPRGPAFVSIPMDDWDAEADEDRAVHARRRVVDGRAVPDPAELAQLASLLESARSPVLVAGPDVDASGGWNAAVALAEKQRLPVWAPPATASSRIGFPERHPNFMGILPPAIGPVAEVLIGHDVVLVFGSSVFAYSRTYLVPSCPRGPPWSR